VAAVSPGLFAAGNRGTYVEIYATGLGPLNGQRSSNEPQVIIGGSQTEVLYSGLAPGFPGLYQINATIPAGTSVNSSVMIRLGGKQSNTIQLQ
jgi:uncharacterized protein (TIGR03437 family)